MIHIYYMHIIERKFYDGSNAKQNFCDSPTQNRFIEVFRFQKSLKLKNIPLKAIWVIIIIIFSFYDMTHIISIIIYGAYHMDHRLWSIAYG